ncbi:MAG: prolipoprotein diacylglyceryl transferase [FCB group bacterium]|jgi:prolipoprotein diacylglyceryl transferase
MNLLAYIYWGSSPEIFSIGPVSIRWYGLLFSLGFVIGYQILSWIFKNENKSQKDLEVLTVFMIIGTVVGARLGHCLFYEPSYYLANPVEILKVWKGGLASHGAALGILISLILYCRKVKTINLIWIFDRIVIVIALSACLIRLGNFMNSEIIGKAASIPWAVVFLRVDHIPRHPAQLYESISYLILFFILFFIYRKKKSAIAPGTLVGIFLTFLFVMRFILEFFKERQVSFEASLPLDMGQLLSIPFIITGIYFLIRARRSLKVKS